MVLDRDGDANATMINEDNNSGRDSQENKEELFHEEFPLAKPLLQSRDIRYVVFEHVSNGQNYILVPLY